MKILAVHSSPAAENSSSRKMGDRILERMKKTTCDAKIKTVDLWTAPPPHWGQEQVAASFTPLAARSNSQKNVLTLSDRYCQELLGCDKLFITAPMWNFGIPSILKSWIDHIVRVNLTFEYSATGKPEGLLINIERAIIVTSAGGLYSGGLAESFDHAGPYLKMLFEFLGVKCVDLVRIEGTALDISAAFEKAASKISEINF
jgi:FMN-dependent NADH-azoreductase